MLEDKTYSQYTNFVANTGIASAVIFIFIFANAAYQGLKTYKNNGSAIALALAAFIISMFSVAFFGAAFLNRFPLNFFLFKICHLNGFLITRINVPALIITLGTMNIYRGLTMLITKGVYITPIPSVYQVIGKGFIPFVFFIVVLGVFIYITLLTRFGRNLFAIGGAEQSALYSGVPVRRFKIIVYVISGFLSALAGLILVGKSGFIQPQAGLGYELNAIAAVVIGGTSIFGGSGSVLGTFFGSVLMGLILAGLTMLAVNPYWQGLITGLLIVLAIVLDSIRYLKK